MELITRNIIQLLGNIGKQIKLKHPQESLGAAVYEPESQPNNRLLSLWLTAKSLEPDCLNGDKYEKMRVIDLRINLHPLLFFLYLISVTFWRAHPRCLLTVN